MTKIIYIVDENTSSDELDVFKYLMHADIPNNDNELQLFVVNSAGIVSPQNSEIQRLVDARGVKQLPIAISFKSNSFFTPDELSSFYVGLDIQI